MNILVLGPAGVGKSTLAKALAEKLGFDLINADPAAKILPYKPKINIRSSLKVEEIMKNFKLGPNGAILKAMELLPSKLTIPEGDFVIDMPGQLDVLILSKSSEYLAKIGDVGLFLIDCSRSDEEILAQLLLFLATYLRLPLQMLYIFSKADMCSAERRKKIRRFKLEIRGNLAEIFERVKIKELLPAQRQVFVSAFTGEGLDELIDLLEEIHCTCGDLT